ncbi:MAG: hypothetical protein EOO08_03110 [Chitinophagaceae bacterium]|nr:MAG: hypothetical protein EOO08_03110 [Chitinophagaceae bacterium]
MHAPRPFRIAITLFYFLICCYLFFTSGSQFPKEDWLDRIFFDKWVHVGLFALLTVLLVWSEFVQGNNQGRWVAVAGIVYGALVEVVQGLWVPFRSADIFDFLSDSVGVLLALYVLERRKKSKPL